jgi:hypothetical protein
MSGATLPDTVRIGRRLAVTLRLHHALLALMACAAAGGATPAAHSAQLPQLEAAYADFNDAYGAVSLLDSNPAAYPGLRYAGRTRQAWQQLYVEKRAQLSAGLAMLPPPPGGSEDARALALMRAALAESTATPQSPAVLGRCGDASRNGLKLTELQQALYACFTERGDRLSFEGRTLTRVAAFELLTHLPEAQRRKALFMAFMPLWEALNGDDGASSPYRRMIVLAAEEARREGSPLDAAARTLGITSSAAESWMVRMLATWGELTHGAQVEPWDYRFEAGAAERELAEAIPRAALAGLNQRYYLDLGLDLERAGVIYDLEPRAGKAPLAYTDYVRRGRMLGDLWQPTLVRVSASYGRGGLGLLNELVHESGHAAHMLALHTRPAFMDLGDAIFYEAVADVPSWSVYEPAWQQKYLGRQASESRALRALFSAVMLDVAWALFDTRMLRDPAADPNALWTDITTRYLHIRPHPELAWWAVRVQLIDKPGYMVNYGLGAVITADIRQRIAQQLGPFTAGDPRWFGWIAQHLLRSGETQPTSELLRQFLGRPVDPGALLAQLQRIAPRSP